MYRRVITEILCEIAALQITGEQVCFTNRRVCMYQLFALKYVPGRSLDKQKKVFVVCMDLEKADDGVDILAM